MLMNIKKMGALFWRTDKTDSLAAAHTKKTQKELLVLNLPKESKPRKERTKMIGLKEIKYIDGGHYEQERTRLEVSQYQKITDSLNKDDLENYIFALPKNNDSMFTIILNPYTNKYELWTIEWEELERFQDEFWEN